MIITLYKNKLSQFSKTSTEVIEKARFVIYASICAIAVGIISVGVHSIFNFQWHLIIGDLIGLICYSIAFYIITPKNLMKSINLIVWGIITALFIHTVIGDFLVADNLSPFKVYHTLMIQLLVLIFVGVVAVEKKQVILFSIMALVAVILHFFVLIFHGIPIDGEFIATAITIVVEAVLAAAGINFFYNFSHRVLKDLKQQKSKVSEKNEVVIEQNSYLERKINERTEALKKSNDNLKMFSYAVSHDVREPLRMISSFIGLIERELKQKELDREVINEYAHFAIDGSQRLDAMINDLLLYTKLDRHKNQDIESVDLNDIMEVVQLNLQVLVQEKNATIHVGKLPSVFANQGNMMLLFQNMIANGIKYTKPGVAPIIQIDAEVTCSKATILIKDNGRGINPYIINEIFKPFRRGNNADEEKGTGIGLAICQKIVENHEGKVTVESEVGKGSTFLIELPLVIESLAKVVQN